MVVTPKPQQKKLLERVRDAIRTKHYSARTEKTYIDWIERYIIFHKNSIRKTLAWNKFVNVLPVLPQDARSMDKNARGVDACRLVEWGNL